ncbi:MAG TPA: ABC transporter permease [Candidatus Limnocylindrales bacterium]|nr:ABC transporter permease [Candidatus Limnocylindrales bacterium]
MTQPEGVKPTSAPEPPPTSPTNAPRGRTMGDRVRTFGDQVYSAMALPLLAIGLALIVGAIVIIATSALEPGAEIDFTLPFRAYGALFEGSLGSPNGRVSTLVQTAPLILAGLGIGLAFKAGLFNIGAQGQFLLGATAAIAAGVAVEGSGPFVAIPVAIAAGMVVGAIWGFIPGFLKAFSGAHEVVTTIMLNFIALALMSWLISGPLRLPRSPQPVTPTVEDAALPIMIGRDGHVGILIAFIAVPIIWFLLYRLTLGFEIRAVGANPEASRYAGMKPKRLVTLTMSLAGMLAGLAGTLNVLGINHQMNATFTTTVGFDAITVALLGRSHPVGIMLAALLFGMMRAGAGLMQIQAGVPAELVDLLQAVILLFLVASPVLRRVFRLRGVKSGLGTTDTMARTYGNEAIR